MKIVLAPDSFKGSLSSMEAARAMAAGFRQVIPQARLVLCPLADGGEGTAEVLAAHLDADSCLIESARHIGLNLPAMRSANVMARGSGALGDVLRQALDRGVQRLIVALGGSATNDGGLGMLMHLGMKAWDRHGHELSPDLEGLMHLASIDPSGLDERLQHCRITALVDVENPLLGKSGASAVYGPQKGLAPERFRAVDAAMRRFADLAERTFRRQCRDQAGAGAAGGLGFAFMLLGARLESGASFVLQSTGFRDRVAGADWVVTGEGCSDMQTLAGKLPWKVAGIAREMGIRCALVSGRIERSAVASLERHFDRLVPLIEREEDTTAAMEQARDLLQSAASDLARDLVATPREEGFSF